MDNGKNKHGTVFLEERETKQVLRMFFVFVCLVFIIGLYMLVMENNDDSCFDIFLKD